jgi:Domain of unknown function (DUF4336)
MSLTAIPESFPASTRQALVNKAKSLQLTRGSYSTTGWSNRLGAALTPASIPGVYTADRPFYWNKIDVGCRMTVIELQDSTSSTSSSDSSSSDSSSDSDKLKQPPDLWIHSPVGLDGPLIATLAQLGTVRHVVSPNFEHVKFAKQWADHYPDASMWACPGMMAKHPEVRWTGEIPAGARPGRDEPWDTQAAAGAAVIQALHVDCEVNPFTGTPFFNEVIYFHVPSATLMTTDLYWNYPDSDGVTNSNYNDVDGKQDDFGDWDLAPAVPNIPIGSKLWKQGMDRLFAPFYLNFMVQEKPRLREIANCILDDWNPSTVIPAHGDVIRGRTLIQTVLRTHFGLSKI